MVLKKLYWDSCVFIDLLAKTPGRINAIQSIVDLASDEQDFEIYTSRITVVEVVRIGEDLNSDKDITGMWVASPVKFVEVHSMVTEEALSLVRSSMAQRPKLRTVDAIHLATAKRMGVEEIHTYDGKMQRIGKKLGLKVCEPRADLLPFPTA